MNYRPTIAIIGTGRWGRKLMKEFYNIARIKSCFDKNKKENLRWTRLNYPDIFIASSYEKVLNDPDVEAVVISTPISSHHELAKKALTARKHVFVEKPMTKSSKEAHELDELANENGLILFTGFTFIYSSIFEKLRELLRKKRVKHIKFEWMKFGFFDVEEIWNYFLAHSDFFSQTCNLNFQKNKE